MDDIYVTIPDWYLICAMVGSWADHWWAASDVILRKEQNKINQTLISRKAGLMFEACFDARACLEILYLSDSPAACAAQQHIDHHNKLLSRERNVLSEIDFALRFYAGELACRQCASHLDDVFCNWHERALARGIPVGPIYMLLCDGAYLKTIDQRFRRRNGWAKKAVLDAMAIWPSLNLGLSTKKARSVYWQKTDRRFVPEAPCDGGAP